MTVEGGLWSWIITLWLSYVDSEGGFKEDYWNRWVAFQDTIWICDFRDVYKSSFCIVLSHVYVHTCLQAHTILSKFDMEWTPAPDFGLYQTTECSRKNTRVQLGILSPVSCFYLIITTLYRHFCQKKTWGQEKVESPHSSYCKWCQEAVTTKQCFLYLLGKKTPNV